MCGHSSRSMRASRSRGAQIRAAECEKIIKTEVLYFGGIERLDGAPEGAAWRHLFDGWVTLYPHEVLRLMAHANYGQETNTFGVSRWIAAALYASVHPTSWLYLAARGDRFHETKAANASGTAAPIFFPADWVSSFTSTVDFRPFATSSIRVEYRHDSA